MAPLEITIANSSGSNYANYKLSSFRFDICVNAVLTCMLLKIENYARTHSLYALLVISHVKVRSSKERFKRQLLQFYVDRRTNAMDVDVIAHFIISTYFIVMRFDLISY